MSSTKGIEHSRLNVLLSDDRFLHWFCIMKCTVHSIDEHVHGRNLCHLDPRRWPQLPLLMVLGGTGSFIWPQGALGIHFASAAPRSSVILEVLTGLGGLQERYYPGCTFGII